MKQSDLGKSLDPNDYIEILTGQISNHILYLILYTVCCTHTLLFAAYGTYSTVKKY